MPPPDGLDPHVCTTCGAHYPEAADLPAVCLICADERQYVPETGQSWARHAALAAERSNWLAEAEPDLWEFGLEPTLAIGQRALLVRTGEGNVFWDCVPILTGDGLERLRALGGVDTVAVSHPHFYTGAALFAEGLGAKVLLHAADREHVTYPSKRIEYWEGERLPLPGGVTLIRAGGHFAGGTVLHWAAGAGGRGALLTADIIRVVPDRRFVAFLYSYPNQIPLPAREVERVGAAVEPFEFDRIYGGWRGAVVASGAKEAVRRSVARYRRVVEERLDGANLPWPE